MAARTQESPVKILEQKLRSNPQSRVFSRLADMYRARGDIGPAINLCLEGLAEHPNYITGRLVLGRCYAEQKNFQAAIEELKKVCVADRRNHAALKMLADTFIKLGRAEEAGSLYRILFEMEPDNSSVKNLAAKHKSGDKRNIFDILGIKPVSLASSMQNLKSSGVDELADIQNLDTIQTETLYSPTIMFDAKGADFTGAMPSAVGEPTGGDIEKQLDSIFGDLDPQTPFGNDSSNTFAPQAGEPTGADIENQFDAMFGTQTPAPASQSGDMDMFTSAPMGEPTGLDIENQLDSMFGIQAPAAPASQSGDMDMFTSAPMGEPTGLDIENQLDSMFGTQAPAAPAPQSGDMDMFTSVPMGEPTGLDIENQLDSMFGTQAPAAPASQSGDMDMFASAPMSEPTGLDIENQLDAMFGAQAPAAASQSGDANTLTPAADELSGEDIQDRLDFLFAEPDSGASNSGGEQDMVFFDSGIADNNSKDELGFDELLLSNDNELSGDDIEDKLNTLFGVTASGGVETEKSILTSGQLNLPANPPADQDVLGEDISSRIDELFAQHGDGNETPDFSNAAADSGKDEVSGEDIESRMAELFGSSGASAGQFDNSALDQQADAICGDSDYKPFDSLLSELPTEENTSLDQQADAICGDSDYKPFDSLLSELPTEENTSLDQQADAICGDSDYKPFDSLLSELPVEEDMSLDQQADAICGDSDYKPFDSLLSELPVDDQIQPPGILLDESYQTENGYTEDLIDFNNTESGGTSAARQYAIDEDDVQEKIRQLFKSGVGESETINTRTNFGEEAIDERDTALELPDHVLTPTLADIYFQQGQPQLSLQIYERLALRDPKDPRLQSKIQEIKDFLGPEPNDAKKKT